ncbi:hypothetical protein [Mangrovimonas aestuarii]|uniref:hypothetical protein n=1 Tax=Mangrovimonas aestuarii TaxID=3018443 RepID=UPI002378E0C9|nr:hypothetical protein [Mangrovimonas aestuarii]
MRYLFLILVLILNGCVITNTPGFYNGYKKLSVTEKENVIFLEDSSSISNLSNEGRVVAINGKQLKTYSKEVDSLLIYRWGPHCSAESCILISACQEYCNSKNYKLAVVAEYYDMQIMYGQNTADLPILIPNHKYYGKYYANSLNKKFTEDLLVETNQKYDPANGRFLLLSRGKIVRQIKELY